MPLLFFIVGIAFIALGMFFVGRGWGFTAIGKLGETIKASGMPTPGSSIGVVPGGARPLPA